MEEFSALDSSFSRKIAGFAGIEENIALQKLMKSAREGHLCLPLSKLNEEEKERIIKNKNILCDFICIESEKLYLEKNFVTEKIIKDEICRLSFPSGLAASAIENFPLLNKEQQEAVQSCLQNRLTFLSGGPGTGKTHTASAIVSSFDPAKEKRVVLAAPTGRAADHLQANIFKKCGVKYPSSTLHKLLKIGSFPPWPKEQFALNLDLLIVDEASMIDAPLFATLLKAIPDHCTTVFMGDPNQLSPVGIGNVFHDLVKSVTMDLKRVALKQSMRTANQEILLISNQVLHGEMPAIELHASSNHPILMTQESSDPEELLNSLSKHRVLNCLRVGSQGVDALNAKALKQTIANAQRGKWWWAPIMIGSNDDETGLCNGEIGIYMEKKEKRGSGFAYFSKEQGQIPLYALPKFEWSFCSSVHKSQGCEYDEVVILVPPGSEIFGREMLYTAITRAKQSVKIVGEKQTLQAMLSKSLAKHSGFV